MRSGESADLRRESGGVRCVNIILLLKNYLLNDIVAKKEISLINKIEKVSCKI